MPLEAQLIHIICLLSKDTSITSALDSLLGLIFGKKNLRTHEIFISYHLYGFRVGDYRVIMLVVTDKLSRWIGEVAAWGAFQNNGESSMTIVNKEKRLN